MKLGFALATLALLTLTPSVPASAAKDDKLAKCNAKKKRTANLYGTILPTLPARAGVTAAMPAALPAAPVAPPTNLFPAPAPDAPVGAEGPVGSADDVRVPAIGAAMPSSDRHAALPTSYASC